jgi:hypothetical protein
MMNRQENFIIIQLRGEGRMTLNKEQKIILKFWCMGFVGGLSFAGMIYFGYRLVMG